MALDSYHDFDLHVAAVSGVLCKGDAEMSLYSGNA